MQTVLAEAGRPEITQLLFRVGVTEPGWELASW